MQAGGRRFDPGWLHVTPAEFEERAARVPEWTADGAALRRDFDFPDFVAAFGFMTQVALLAERAGHHPDWSNSYRRVSVSLTSHDAGRVTDRDFALAQAIDALVA